MPLVDSKMYEAMLVVCQHFLHVDVVELVPEVDCEQLSVVVTDFVHPSWVVVLRCLEILEAAAVLVYRYL